MYLTSTLRTFTIILFYRLHPISKFHLGSAIFGINSLERQLRKSDKFSFMSNHKVVLPIIHEVLQAEMAKIKKQNQELAKGIQVQERVNTFAEPESCQFGSNEGKDNSREESRNSIPICINSDIRVLNREKSKKKRHVCSGQTYSKLCLGINQKRISRFNQVLSITCNIRLMT